MFDTEVGFDGVRLVVGDVEYLFSGHFSSEARTHGTTTTTTSPPNPLGFSVFGSNYSASAPI